MFKEKKLDRKNIVMIIASDNFRDEEYFIPYEMFQKEGAKVITASSVKGEIIGVEGGEAKSTLTLKDVNMKDFDAAVFVGGEGAKEYFDNNDAHRIAQETVAKLKTVGAICIAPVILAKAGILSGKKATVWSTPYDKSGIEELKRAGCIVSEERVVKDKKIITADGPAVAENFAKAVIEAIAEKEMEQDQE